MIPLELEVVDDRSSYQRLSNNTNLNVSIHLFPSATKKMDQISQKWDLVSAPDNSHESSLCRLIFKLKVGGFVTEYLISHGRLVDTHSSLKSNTVDGADGCIFLSSFESLGLTDIMDFIYPKTVHSCIQMLYETEAPIPTLHTIILSLEENTNHTEDEGDLQLSMNGYFSKERTIQQGCSFSIPSHDSKCGTRLKVLECYPTIRGISQPDKTRIVFLPSYIPTKSNRLIRPRGTPSLPRKDLNPWFIPDQSLAVTYTCPLYEKSVFQMLESASIPSSYVAVTNISNLVRMGKFNGDWIAVSSSPNPIPRLFRVFGIKSLPKSIDSVIFVHPNVQFSMHHQNRRSKIHDPQMAFIHDVPKDFDLHSIPKCDSLHLARMPSPESNTKFMLELAENKLRLYLQSKDLLLVSKGDIITVQLNQNEIHLGRAMTSLIQDWLPLEDNVSISDSKPGMSIQFRATRVEQDPNMCIGCVSSSTSRFCITNTKVVLDSVCDPSSPIKLDYGISPFQKNSSYHNLVSLFEISFDPLFTNQNALPVVLVHGRDGSGKHSIIESAAEVSGLHMLEVNSFSLKEETWAKTLAIFQISVEKAAASAPCVLLLSNLQALLDTNTENSSSLGAMTIKKMLQEARTCFTDSSSSTRLPCIIAVTIDDVDRLPPTIRGLFTNEYNIAAPDESERFDLIRHISSGYQIYPSVNLSHLAHHTAGLVKGDIQHIFETAQIHAISRVRKDVPFTTQSQTMATLRNAGIGITTSDISKALEESKAVQSELLKAPKIPNIQWEDIGGLAHVKHAILETIQLPMEHPELFASGVKKRSGVLLYGPPGTGKTLVAKAVATTLSLNFFSVKGPELLNMYIGESEANVRRVFSRAREAKPCVVFFDELDSVAPKRGEKGDSGGVMDRIVSQLLAELDGMADGGSSDVFVIGATNRPDLLDPALLRPGRFDKLLYLGVPSTTDAQVNVLQALTRKFTLAPDLSLHEIAEKCGFTFTGADFYALCSDALLKAMIRKIQEVDQEIAAWNASGKRDEHPHPIDSIYYLEHIASKESIKVQVNRLDFENALAELTPSVTAEELAHYKSLQENFSLSKK